MSTNWDNAMDTFLLAKLHEDANLVHCSYLRATALVDLLTWNSELFGKYTFEELKMIVSTLPSTRDLENVTDTHALKIEYHIRYVSVMGHMMTSPQPLTTPESTDPPQQGSSTFQERFPYPALGNAQASMLGSPAVPQAPARPFFLRPGHSTLADGSSSQPTASPGFRSGMLLFGPASSGTMRPQHGPAGETPARTAPGHDNASRGSPGSQSQSRHPLQRQMDTPRDDDDASTAFGW